MAKPIIVMYMPTEWSIGADGKQISPNEMMNMLNGWGDKYTPDTVLSEYIWLCFHKDSLTEPELQIFYEKDHEPITNEELKELVYSNINAQTK